MKYLRKSFSVPASQNMEQDDWDAIFGTEEERKEKLAKAIAEQKLRPKTPRAMKAGGGTGTGKMQVGPNPMAGGGPGAHFEGGDLSRAAQQEAIHEVCERTAPGLGIDADAMKRQVESVTNDIIGESADMHAHGTTPEIENQGRGQRRQEKCTRAKQPRRG